MSDAATLQRQNRDSFRAVVHTDPEGGYWAEVPDVPGCVTQGETLDELYHNLAEAIACHLDLDTDSVRGSHQAWSKAGYPSVTVPVHKGRDLKKGLLATLLKQSGLSESDL